MFRHFLKWTTNGRGMGHIHRIFARLVPVKTMMIGIRLEEDAIFKMPASDSYWGSYLLSGLQYEPEIDCFLQAISSVDFCFIDAGANYGYWSILVGSRRYGSHPCLAIEASEENFAFLDANRLANGSRFHCVQRAVMDTSNEKLFFQQAESHAASLVVNGGSQGQPGIYVDSITLDDAIRSFFGHLPERLVIKLDVEGAEREAMAGAGLALEQCDVLTIFECHGSDRQSRNLSYMLEHGFFVAFVADNGTLSEIKGVEDAAEIKQDPQRGYNFVAVRPKPDSRFHRILLRWIARGRIGGLD